MMQDSVRKPVIHWFHVLLYLLDLRAGCGIRIEIINTAILSIHPGNVPEPSCRVVEGCTGKDEIPSRASY